jgi:hypothetical protein
MAGAVLRPSTASFATAAPSLRSESLITRPSATCSLMVYRKPPPTTPLMGCPMKRWATPSPPAPNLASIAPSPSLMTSLTPSAISDVLGFLLRPCFSRSRGIRALGYHNIVRGHGVGPRPHAARVAVGEIYGIHPDAADHEPALGLDP